MGSGRKSKLPYGSSFLVLSALAIFPAFLLAQLPSPPPNPEMTMRVDVDWVVLPISVTDSQFRAYSGLGPENFEVYEDGQRQQVTRVQEVDTPISVGLVFDVSGSVRSNMELCREAVRTFFRSAHADDEYFLIEFSSRPDLLVPFTVQRETILKHVGAARAAGRTAMYDAIYQALAEMGKARHKRKVLFVLSDGDDNFSTASEEDIARILGQMENTVQIYTLTVSPMRDFRLIQREFGRQLPDFLSRGPINMARLAELSGGSNFVLDGPSRLLEAVGKASRELRSQYEVTYHSSNEDGGGRWRSVRVKVKPPRGAPSLEAHTRPGYFPGAAPTSSLSSNAPSN